jgi:diadenosine tetraphosphatase ApaH/serine/threonine PP2A family protein phosphatase
MRALVLSDIHANLEALQAVLDAAAGQWDVLWNLGDIVGYGASPNDVLDLLHPLGGLTVRGNHDRVCSGISSAVNFNPAARAAAEWTLENLTADHLLWLRTLPQGPIEPESATSGCGETRVTLAHGSPLDEDQYILNMRDAWAPLQQMTTAVTFVGHTHVQGGFQQHEHEWHEIHPRYAERRTHQTWSVTIKTGSRQLINPGSVGQPRDHDWRAAFAIYNSEACSVTYHRVPYDVAKAQQRILAAQLPERLAARLREGR